MESMAEFFGEPISVYTREQAIEDGELVDVSEWAAETGFSAPVVFTRALWTVIDIDSRPRKKFNLQSTRGRAHDVLWMAYLRVRGLQRRVPPNIKLSVGRHLHLFGNFDVLLTDGRKKHATLRVSVDGDGVTIGFPEDF